jgi:hypothetical protein
VRTADHRESSPVPRVDRRGHRILSSRPSSEPVTARGWSSTPAPPTGATWRPCAAMSIGVASITWGTPDWRGGVPGFRSGRRRPWLDRRGGGGADRPRQDPCVRGAAEPHLRREAADRRGGGPRTDRRPRPLVDGPDDAGATKDPDTGTHRQGRLRAEALLRRLREVPLRGRRQVSPPGSDLRGVPDRQASRSPPEAWLGGPGRHGRQGQLLPEGVVRGRQLEVLRSYSQDGSVAAAAHELGISETTARQHQGCTRRTGCLNAAQAAYWLGSSERNAA